MKPYTPFLLGLLALGCSDQPSALEADGGSTVPLGRRELVPPGFGSRMWTRARVPAGPSRVAATTTDARHDSGLTPVPRLAPDGAIIPPDPRADAPMPQVHDAGQPMAADDEDAGSEGPAPCSTSNCLCSRVCERGLALACPAEDALDVCVAQCDAAESDCYEQLLRTLHCRVALPAAAYSCDPDLLVFVVEGCAAEVAAFNACRSF